MKFGVFDHMDGNGAGLASLFADRLRLVEAYDQAGIHCYHLAEHHSTPLGYAPSPGIFLSAVAYFTKDDPPETIVPRSPASAGYCRLRRFDPDAFVDPANMRELPNSDPSVVCIGSPSTANLVPSLFDAFYETDRAAQLILEHQSGSNPQQIYLRVFVENSKWHAFARISIRRL